MLDKVVMTDDKLDKLMAYYLEERHYDRLKYFWEVSIPARDEDLFICWLQDCEAIGLIFSFAAVERYKGSVSFYGFSNFEVVKRKNMKLMQLYFLNDDILYQQFMSWREESKYFVMSTMLRLHMELDDLLEGRVTAVEPDKP